MSTQAGLEAFLERPEPAAAVAQESAPVDEPAPAAKEGETSASPAQADRKEAPKPAEDDLWADPPEASAIPRDVYVATRKKWRGEFDKKTQHAAETERQLAELRGQLSVYQQQSQAGQPAPPVVDEDSEFYGKPVSFIKDAVRSEVGTVRGELAKARYELSEELVRDKHADFDEKANAFAEAANSNPALLGQFRSSRNPARFVYEQGKTLLEMRGVGSIDELKTKLTKQITEELEAKFRKQGALASAERASTSSAGARGSGSTSQHADDADEPLSVLFKGVGL